MVVGTFLLVVGITTNIQMLYGVPLNVKTPGTTPADYLQCPIPADDCFPGVDEKKCETDGDCLTQSFHEGCCPLAKQCGTDKFCQKLIPIVKTSTPTPTPTLTRSLICQKRDSKDVLFIVDGTANSRQPWKNVEREFNEIKQFLMTMISELNSEKFRIGVMQFGGRHEPRMEIQFLEGRDQARLMRGVRSIRQLKGSLRKTGEALAAAGNKFYEANAIYDRYNDDDLIVLITRGRAMDESLARNEITLLKRRRIRVMAVGVSPHPERLRNHLDYLVSRNSDLYLVKHKHLGRRKVEVLQGICTPAIQAGSAVVGYCQNEPYDIFIVLDGSASINYRNFNKKRKVLGDLLVSLDNSTTNVGLMQFSERSQTKILLELGTHSTERSLNVVETMDYQSGKRTMLGNALRLVNEEVFNGFGGDRRGVKNVLLIFSDGVAHDLPEALQQAEILKNKDVLVVTISGASGVVAAELKAIASEPRYSLQVKLNGYSDNAKQIVSSFCKL